MQKKKLDLAVLLLIAVIVFGGMHLIGNKRLDGEGPRLAAMSPAAGR